MIPWNITEMWFKWFKYCYNILISICFVYSYRVVLDAAVLFVEGVKQANRFGIEARIIITIVSEKKNSISSYHALNDNAAAVYIIIWPNCSPLIQIAKEVAKIDLGGILDINEIYFGWVLVL